MELLELRVKLFKTHLEEQQQSLADENQARSLLKTTHDQQRRHLKLTNGKDLASWLNLIARQAEEMTALAHTSSEKRNNMLSRQKEEQRQLDQQINRAREVLRR